VNLGLRGAGFGQTLHLPWNGPNLPPQGSAAPRRELDAAIRFKAIESGAEGLEGARAVDVEFDGERLAAVVFARGEDRMRIAADHFVVADGARSQLGRLLGRVWHKDTVYGVAARGYTTSTRSDDPWISSHLELRGPANEILSGYGWIFPLGEGKVNIGVGTLASSSRPADINLKQLMGLYAGARREEWGLGEVVDDQKSALLPMGGAVSGVAGSNWVLVGDAAGCVNPLNGEGIDYGLETGRLAAEFLADRPKDCTSWAGHLTEHYGQAFSIARRLAGIASNPDVVRALGPVGMRSRSIMKVALRLMGNLVTEADSDFVAKAWRVAGRWSTARDARPPFH
jgi:geranylgeranyl reductase family protein